MPPDKVYSEEKTMNDVSALLRAKADALRAEARTVRGPRYTPRVVYLLVTALQRAASELDDRATAIEDEVAS